MKKLKFGFATLVAILAIGLTIAAQAGVFENKKLVADENSCFDVRTGSGLTISIKPQDVCATTVVLSQSLDCTEIYDDNSSAIFTQLTASSPEVSSIEIDCPGTQKICCVEIQPYTSACANQPLLNFGTGTTLGYEVKEIHCLNP